MLRTHGIHHISSTTGHPQEDLDYNAGILGLRLVKQTLNFDDQETFHLYYGNERGDTGLTTTFPIPDAVDGEVGGGQVARILYAVRPGQTAYWSDRLERFRIPTETQTVMGQEQLTFADPTGLQMGMLETELGPDNGWSFAGVSGDTQITGIHAATLVSQKPEITLEVLTKHLGYSLVAEDERYYQLKIHDELGGLLYLQKDAVKRGRMGKGTVHHIAFTIKDDEIDAWQSYLTEAGLLPTTIRERKYFRSIYFRERGGILIELATDGPGVLIDEELDHLGERFQVPPDFADEEERIRAEVMPLEVREVEAIGSYGYRNREEYELWRKCQTIREQINDLNKKQTEQGLSVDEEDRLAELRRDFLKSH